MTYPTFCKRKVNLRYSGVHKRRFVLDSKNQNNTGNVSCQSNGRTRRRSPLPFAYILTLPYPRSSPTLVLPKGDRNRYVPSPGDVHHLSSWCLSSVTVLSAVPKTTPPSYRTSCLSPFSSFPGPFLSFFSFSFLLGFPLWHRPRSISTVSRIRWTWSLRDPFSLT